MGLFSNTRPGPAFASRALPGQEPSTCVASSGGYALSSTQSTAARRSSGEVRTSFDCQCDHVIPKQPA